MSENLLLRRRPAPRPRAVPNTIAPLRNTVYATAHPPAVASSRPTAVTPTHGGADSAPCPTVDPAPAFAARNSPTDLLFRGLWQLVGVYVFLVLLVKDHKLPR